MWTCLAYRSTIVRILRSLSYRAKPKFPFLTLGITTIKQLWIRWRQTAHTFNCLVHEWHAIKCPQGRNALSTFSWRHILTNHCFSMHVDFMLHICNDFPLLVRGYITPKQKHVDRKGVLWTTLNWVGQFLDITCSGASMHLVSLHLPVSHGKLKPAC